MKAACDSGGPRRLRFAAPAPYALMVAVLFLGLFNMRFWQEAAAVFRHGAADLLFLLSLFVLLALLFTMALLLLPGNRLLHVGSGMLFPLAAMAAYTADSFGLAVDEDMVRSLALASQAEARSLLGPRLLFYALGLGVLPLFVVGACRLRPLGFYRQLRHRLLFCGGALALSALLVIPFASRYEALLRSHQHLHYLLVPAAALQGAAQFAAASLEQFGEDAPAGMAHLVRRAPAAPGGKPLLVFLVVGETARHASFQLGGYARPTNPLLSGIGNLYYFSGFEACGTSTAVSLPCMFSALGRERFSLSRARRSPNALELLAGAGIRVQWRSNNSGSASVSARLPVIDFTTLRPPGWCSADSCLDEVLLTGLEQELAAAGGDTLIAFHQMGSHGPGYFRRYPPGAETFTPACQSNELGRCSRDEIRNAYDNSIVYTDHVLAAQIAMLAAASDRFDTALLYVSDHGESLGENRVYLHGAPFASAPAEQKRVPFMLWMSEGYRQRMGVDGPCLRRQLGRRFSHDNVYHTLLGAMGARSERYRGEMDVLAACRADGG